MSTRPGALGEFLRARRSRLLPADIGLRPYGERRRVAGLRREEVASRAGLSAPYYARLEQGTSRGASPEVLDAIARALELDERERGHLHELAVPRRQQGHLSDERLAEPLAQLLPVLADTPALVLGRRMDVLAWNPLGHALLAGHLDVAGVEQPARRPNNARAIFLDPRTAALYPQWRRKARAVVGHLRMVAGRHPDDRALTALIGELSASSPEFAALWADHTVGACEGATYPLAHPVAGPLTVHQQTLNPVGAAEQSLVTITVTPGSASERALRTLAANIPGAVDR